MIYIIYLFIEQPTHDQDDPYNFSKYQLLQLDRHKQGIENISQRGGKLSGIIMGGSNAMAGLSARQISDHNNNEIFYNLTSFLWFNFYTPFCQIFLNPSLFSKFIL